MALINRTSDSQDLGRYGEKFRHGRKVRRQRAEAAGATESTVPALHARFATSSGACRFGLGEQIYD